MLFCSGCDRGSLVICSLVSIYPGLPVLLLLVQTPGDIFSYCAQCYELNSFQTWLDQPKVATNDENLQYDIFRQNEFDQINTNLEMNQGLILQRHLEEIFFPPLSFSTDVALIVFRVLR